MIRYRLGSSLIPLKEGEDYGENDIRVELMTKEEFRGLDEMLPHKKVMLRQLEQIQYCKAELFGGCIAGTFAVPNVKNLPGKKENFGFYMTKGRLILIEEADGIARALLGRMKEIQYGEQASMAMFFTGFLDYLIGGDAIFLQEYEKKLVIMEDNLMKRFQKNYYEKIIRCRKDVMHMQSYFTQMENLGDSFRSNTNHLFSEEERELFAIFSDRVARLNSHAGMLREYIIQIREMYQSQLDLEQNRTMNLLTVVTTIFFPLTLIVGWYGMNFVNMPELTWKYGYTAVVLASIGIIVMEIVYFHKKHLL